MDTLQHGNHNHSSTPNRVRRALRDDAVRAAEDFAAMPTDRRTPTAYAEARERAQPYLDFLAVADLLRPVDLYVNDAELATESHNTGYAVEFRHDVRPSGDEMLAAYSDGMRPFVRTSPLGKVETFAGGVHFHPGDNAMTIGGRSSTRRFYGLHFVGGALLYWGQNGRRERVVDEQSDARGPEADNDNFEVVRKTTASAGAPDALPEIDRAREASDLLTRMGESGERLLKVIMQADTFAEVAVAAGLPPTSHNGRRATIKTLAEVKKLLAA
ncbi:hypothetical protein [Bosea sp. 2RAB26]|uniref:hypothetical protein n=1 Tax=Bosea sp. 2RAB26 TaxID=3237476 RepID=UPI003F903B35